MPMNPAGVVTPPSGTYGVAGQTIESAKYNALVDDYANVMTDHVAVDGRKAMSGDLDMGGNNVTNVAAGVLDDDVAIVGQIQGNVLRQASAVGGTVDAITITMSPATSAWTAGESGRFTAAGANTSTTPTLNKDSLGAKTIVKWNGAALVPGDIVGSGHQVEWMYNGTNVVILNPGTLQSSMISTDAGATEGPTLDLYRDSASPAAADVGAGVVFNGKSSTAVKRAYARLRAVFKTVTNGAEDGLMAIRTMVGGTEADRVIVGNGLYTAGATGGDKGANTINASAVYKEGVRIDGWEWIETITISGATASATSTGLSAYKAIRLTLINVKPVDDGRRFLIQLSSDGSTYLTTTYQVWIMTSAITPADGTGGFSLEDGASPGTDIGNAAGDGGLAGSIILYNFNVAQKTFITGQFGFGDTTGTFAGGGVEGWHTSQTAMQALKFLFNVGDISTATIIVEGMRG